jgi:hypothetical protein
MGRRALIAVLLLAFAVVPLAACGTEEAVAPDEVAKAAETTIAAGGSKLALNGTLTGPKGEQVKLTGSGVVDRRGSTEIEMKLSAAGETQTMRGVVVGEVIYLSSSLFEDLPGGKEWLKIDYGKIADEIGISDLPQIGSSDPSAALRNLRAVADVEKVGSEDVRGVSTTHYKATVNLRDLPAKVPADEREAARRSVERLIRLTGSDQQKTEVWIDDEDLVRRTRDRYSIGSGAQQAEADETTEFFDFGTRAKIEVPADSEAVDATKLAAREARKESKPG